MGRRGSRSLTEPSWLLDLGLLPEPPLPSDESSCSEKVQRKSPNTLAHHSLCILAAKWLRRGGQLTHLHCSTVVVEPFSMNVDEQPDVFGWNYWTTALIEVKVSRSDFTRDFKKPFRSTPALGVGEHRFYCCPENMIAVEELPSGWGLLYEAGGKIVQIKPAERVESNHKAEFHLLASIIRKYGFSPKLYIFTERACAK